MIVRAIEPRDADEEWALSNGYTELTSDTNDSYPLSPAAHAATGFVEVERLICFRKQLKKLG